MNFYSPLRYPGGKNKLGRFVAQICKDNCINGHYVEPYAGGASVALFLLLEGYVSRVTINDSDRSIYAFWYSVLHHTDRLCRLIKEARIDVSEWRKQKEMQRNKSKASLLKLGFSTLFLNRTNISGIMDAGPIGGVEQKSPYKIGCRFNKASLIQRIEKIAERRSSIRLHQLDALDLIDQIRREADKSSSTMFYFDPPYYLKGESLYMNHYDDKDHKAVCRAIKAIKDVHWIVSYDNVPPIKEMYRGFRSKEYRLLHRARSTRIGKELLFFSKDLNLPSVIDPSLIPARAF